MANANGTASPAPEKDAINQQSQTTIYTLFKRTDRQFTLLKAKKTGKRPFYDLPFVNAKKASHKGEAEAWDVPATGGYFGGYETGEAMALAFLKCQRFHSDLSGATHPLTEVVKSFLIRFEQEGGFIAWTKGSGCDLNEGAAALRGQCIGFFNTMSDWVDGAARSMGSSLDQLDEKALIDQANLGLQFDQAVYMASLSDDEEIEKGGA